MRIFNEITRKSTHSQHTCRKTIHKQTRRKRRKPLPQEKEARGQTRGRGKSNQARGAREKRLSKRGAGKETTRGAREKRQSKRKVHRPQSAHLSKKIVFVMVLRMILSDFASEGEGATGASRTVLRGFRSPRQIRFRHRRGSRHREILDHRDVHHRDDSDRRDDSDHREQQDV